MSFKHLENQKFVPYKCSLDRTASYVEIPYQTKSSRLHHQLVMIAIHFLKTYIKVKSLLSKHIPLIHCHCKSVLLIQISNFYHLSNKACLNLPNCVNVINMFIVVSLTVAF